jgi:hypothetical protein
MPKLFDGYRGGDMPLGGYAALMGAYVALFGGIGASLLRSRRLRRLSPGDVALVGVATHKLTRIVTRDWVTIPLRAPFTEYVASAGSGEVDERARGTGLRRAVGDLLTCNYCTGPWVAGALVSSMAMAPRATRAVASMLAAVAVSDFLHEAYENLRALRRLGGAPRGAVERRTNGSGREAATT